MARYTNLPSFPVGTVIKFTSDIVPNGWLLCDGQAVPRTGTYAALFALIANTHGQGDGTTTFNIPDYRGRFLRGVDSAAGRDPNSGARTAMNTGGATGNNVGSVQGSDFASHQHTMRVVSSAGSVPLSSSNHIGSSGVGNAVPVYYAQNFTGADTTLTTVVASSAGNETRPVNAYVNYLIKY